MPFSDKPLSGALETHGLVLQRRQGQISTNLPHLVTHHSPDGYEFGYMGSGPADLALNLLEYLLRAQGFQGDTHPCWRGRCFTLAWTLHQQLKRDLIAACPTEGAVIPWDTLTNWLDTYRLTVEPLHTTENR